MVRLTGEPPFRQPPPLVEKTAEPEPRRAAGRVFGTIAGALLLTAAFFMAYQSRPGQWCRCLGDTDTIEVSINGSGQGRFSAGTSWVRHSGSFVARGDTISISFRAIDSGSVGNFIDQAQLHWVD